MKYNLALLCCGILLSGGCSLFDTSDVRSQSPDSPGEAVESNVQLIGEMTAPFGLSPVQIEAVGLVTGLPGTGSNPRPSAERARLFQEMQRRGVPMPDRWLASASTALVKVRGILRPGIRKGDRFDIEVRVPTMSDTTSLRGGYLMPVQLTELAVLGGRIRDGDELGQASGALLVDPSADTRNDQVAMGRGRILGGGVAQEERSLALILKPEHRSVFNAARIAKAVNKRFYFTQRGIQDGMANAQTDKYIELDVHPRYRDNIARYIQVVRAIALRETAGERAKRLVLLQKQLLDPVTSEVAALRLEAMGKKGIDVLKKGIQSDNTEVRFRAAEALAYLDDREAAEPLAEAARNHPAFRVFALSALGAMDDVAAHDQLCQLLDVSSAETRYGAFRALRSMRADDPLIVGEHLGGKFQYHVLNTTSEPMIHVTRNRRPEVVLFGTGQQLRAPFSLAAGNNITINCRTPGEVSVARLAVDRPQERRKVSQRLDDVIRAIVDLGGTYPDVIQALQEAEACDALTSRFEVEALPKAGRTFDRTADSPDEENEAEAEELTPDNQGVLASILTFWQR